MTAGAPHLLDPASRALGGSMLVANDETEITSLRLRRLWGKGEA